MTAMAAVTATAAAAAAAKVRLRPDRPNRRGNTPSGNSATPHR
jgi:hypothetical protein